MSSSLNELEEKQERARSEELFRDIFYWYQQEVPRCDFGFFSRFEEYCDRLVSECKTETEKKSHQKIIRNQHKLWGGPSYDENLELIFESPTIYKQYHTFITNEIHHWIAMRQFQKLKE